MHVSSSASSDCACVCQAAVSEWSSRQFVGLLSYKSATKILNNIGVVELIEQTASQYAYADVLALLSPSGISLRRHAQLTHGLHFVEVWHEVLRRLGFDERTIIASDEIDAFFCNYWLAKPGLMVGYIAFLEDAIRLMENDTSLAFLLKADARYSEGRSDVARGAFGTPFYQLHPFVCERLPVVYFWSRRACTVLVHSKFRQQ